MEKTANTDVADIPIKTKKKTQPTKARAPLPDAHLPLEPGSRAAKR